MDASFTIQEFAAMAGVTVKALRHYDRLGLLKPRREPSGYRRYTPADLERLEQIGALKSLGFSLRGIGALLDRAPASLVEALRQQKRALAARRDSLDAALDAIEEAERFGPSPSVLGTLIEVLEMHDAFGEMRCYYKQNEAWSKASRYWRQWPSPPRRRLFGEVSAGSGDPLALAARWLALDAREFGPSPDFRWGSIHAWNNRAYWPALFGERAREFDLERIQASLHQAALALVRQRWSALGLARHLSASHTDLIAKIVTALGDDPSSENSHVLAGLWWNGAPNGGLGQVLIARWRELVASPESPDNQLLIFATERIWGVAAQASYRAWAQE